MDELTASLAETVRTARQDRDLSASQLAERSGVSRAMIGKIERGEAQPTAVLLGRLSAALGMSLSELVAKAEGRRFVKAADQPLWTDPETGYRRRAISPSSGGPLELVEVEFPPKTEVAYPADAYAFKHQQIWLLEGHLTFHEGDLVHELDPGDCLHLGPPAPTKFVNSSDKPCRYVVAIARRA
ncbi:XRE family transcriptional regulator [Actinocrispum sp. NPDC049592]|uniref:helix-turn-helix domain-containing protein n=1 Tax=Actinocrispum sp. NPDC049592 TaxID=3154835 RepID=UPI00342A40A4